ncbi:MAG TPA: hypothetical protein ENI23_12880 [bacterium]|nr:hypothetical protein [bacterium]
MGRAIPCPDCEGDLVAMTLQGQQIKKFNLRYIPRWKYCPACDAMWKTEVTFLEKGLGGK